MNERTDMPIHNLHCTEPDRFAKPPDHEAPEAAILAYLKHSESCAYHARLNQQLDAEMDPLLHAASRDLVVATPSMKKRRQDRRPAARAGNILRRVAALGLAASLTVLLWFGYTSLIEGGMQPSPEVAETVPPPVASPVSPMVQVGENGQLYAARVISDTLEGQRTKSGMIYNPDSLSASVAGLPFGSRLRVTNPVTGASVVVTVIDRGPLDDEINLSASAADSLGFDGMVMLFVDILYTPPPMAIGP